MLVVIIHNAEIDNASLIEANEVIRGHSIETVGNALELQ